MSWLANVGTAILIFINALLSGFTGIASHSRPASIAPNPPVLASSTQPSIPHTQPPDGWHVKYRVTESDVAITPSEPFYLAGKKWRVEFYCTSHAGATTTMTGYFQSVDYLAQFSAFDDLFADAVPCPIHSVQYFYMQPPGQYEISVLSTGSYSVEVDDFY